MAMTPNMVLPTFLLMINGGFASGIDDCTAGQGDTSSLLQSRLNVGQEGSAPPGTKRCGFEAIAQPYCGLWENSKSDTQGFDWTRKTGRTSSWGTGPSKANSGTAYLYIETSSPRRKGDTAVLSASNIALKGGAYLSFGYHMYGRTIGSLQVKVNSAVVKTLSGNKGDKWLTEKVDLSQFAFQTVTVSFVGTRGTSYTGDIAVDDVDFFIGADATTSTTPAPTQPPTTPAPTQPPVPPGVIKKLDAISKNLDLIAKLLAQLLSTTTGPPVSGGLN